MSHCWPIYSQEVAIKQWISKLDKNCSENVDYYSKRNQKMIDASFESVVLVLDGIS